MKTSLNADTDTMATSNPAGTLLAPPAAEPRRSISIFSRRGVETPEPPPLIVQRAIPFHKQVTDKQKSWLNRTKSQYGTGKPMSPKSANRTKKSRATVLKAVPQAKSYNKPELKKEVAVNSKDGVAPVINGDVTESHPERPQSKHGGPGTLLKNAWKSNAALDSSHRDKSQKRKSAEHRVGVWVQGVTQWDAAMQYRAVLDAPSIAEEGIAEESIAEEGFAEESFAEDPGTTYFRHVPVKAAATLGVRPCLSVVIPESHPNQDTTLATLAETKPSKPVEPISLPMSKFNIMTPHIALNEPQVSELELELQPEPVPEPEPELRSPTLEPMMLMSVDQEPHRQPSQLTVSRTSSKSSSDADDDAASSVYSKRSSATSLETGPKLSGSLERRMSGKMLIDMLKEPSAKRVDPKGQESKLADMNKPLPPAPVLRPSRDAPGAPTGTKVAGGMRHTRSMASTPDDLSLRCNSRRLASRSRSWNHLDAKFNAFDLGFMATAPLTPCTSAPTSPTLTQAEDALEAQLSALTATPQVSGEHAEVLPFVDAVEDPVAPPTNISQDCENSSPEGAIERVEVTSEPSSVRQADSVKTVMNPPERAPTLPKRSRKREWRMPPRAALAAAKDLSRRKSTSEAIPSPEQNNASSMVRRCTIAGPSTDHGAMPVPAQPQPRLPGGFGDRTLEPVEELDTFKEVFVPPKVVYDDGLIVVQGPTIMGEDGKEMLPKAVAAATAEEVLLHIFSCLDSTADLLNTAMMNKGMYRVFKENEMHLIRMVTFNESAAAWELREWCPPQRNVLEPEPSNESFILEHTPTTYMQCHRRDARVIENLKATLLKECSTCIRKETAAAFSNPASAFSRRFNDAIWRIWCFCKIFGCEKGREDDITGQLDWLKGGALANSQGFSATVNNNWEFDMNSVLFNPPEYFAKGNEGGLSAEQLYDMTEIWTCLTTLLQGYQGRVKQARAAGVFDDCNIEEGDQEREELMLEEWIYYLLTLGPNVVLEMAAFATNSSSAGFAHAKANAWTIWSPQPSSSSRRTFLKEPVSRLYEERISAATISMHNPHDQLAKEIAKKRVATLAAEIKLARQKSTYRRSPFIDMSMERPMSMASRSDSTSSAPSDRGSVSIFAAALRTPVTPNFPSATRPTSPGWWSQRNISPIDEDCTQSFAKMNLQKRAKVQQDPSRQAIRRIMDMGFSTDQAIWALKMTDTGHGLAVESAVDLLLKQRT